MQTIKIAPCVAEALANNRPVVALESTIISHGMPYPQNVQTAKKVEQIVRDNILDTARCLFLFHGCCG